MNLQGKNVVVTGGSGFLGRHVVEQLEKAGASNVMVPRSSQFDLREMSNCLEITKGKDLVVHLAAHVGGIGLNLKKPGELFYDNAIMGIQLIEACRRNQVEKVVVAGTICAYPKFTPVPFKEEDLWNGYPEETNAPYGVAKKALLVQLQAYRQQYGMNGVFVLPVNLYGPWDNFDLESSHVIPGLIRKVDAAIKSHASEVVMWGDGSPTREFLYVEDAAIGIVAAAQKLDRDDPVNLGSSFEISIKDLANMIGRLMGYKGKWAFDPSKPNGQPRRKLNVDRASDWIGFKAATSLETGLIKTIEWYRKHMA